MVNKIYIIKAKGECTVLSFRIVYSILASLLYVILIFKLTLGAKNAIIIVMGF